MTLYIAPGLLSPGGTPRTPKQANYVIKHHRPAPGENACEACEEAYADDAQQCRPYREALVLIAAKNGQVPCRRCRTRFRFDSSHPAQDLCLSCRDQGALFPEIEES